MVGAIGSRVSLIAVLGVLSLGASILPVTPAGAVATDAAGYPWADFNGDGVGDVAIGAPGEAIGTRREAGAVHVLYGTATGLSASGDQVWHQDTPGVAGKAETGDAFGAAVAVGDFDADGLDDLAIGSPGEGIGGAEDAGTVTVLNGTDAGLAASGSQLLFQGNGGIAGTAEGGDSFGFSLASGDMQGDGATDLAVGVPGQTVASKPGAGSVSAIYGTRLSGLSGTGSEEITQDTAGVAGGAEFADLFGFSLIGGDFDGSGTDDLAIGVPFEDIGRLREAGAVYMIGGGMLTGLDPGGSVLLTQDTIFETDEAEEADGFGFALASGNFNALEDATNPFDDLAIGAPGDLPELSGSVNVMYGSGDGLALPAEEWYQGRATSQGAVAGKPEPGDSFGFALAANDFGGDDSADLAVGVPGEGIGSREAAGGVNVIYSDGNGLDPSIGPDQFWSQDSPGVAGGAESFDIFGARLSSGRLDAAGTDDLVIAAPGENLGAARDAGAVNVLYSDGAKVTATGSDLWTQDSQGIGGGAERGDVLGSSLG